MKKHYQYHIQNEINNSKKSLKAYS